MLATCEDSDESDTAEDFDDDVRDRDFYTDDTSQDSDGGKHN
mgnify:CR=1 FL=1